MLKLLDLPDCMLYQLLDYMPYNDVAQLRQVSRRFNGICQAHLNTGFVKLGKLIERDLKNVQARLPRRVSQRRSSTISVLANTLMSVDTQLQILGLVFNSHIREGACCFMSGKVIDEAYSVRRILFANALLNKPINQIELLEELRDLSSMAVEYFKGRLLPDMQRKWANTAVVDRGQLEEADSYFEEGDQKTALMFKSFAPVPVIQPAKAAEGCTFAQLHASIRCLDGKYNKVVKRLKTMTAIQRLQSRHIRYNGQQIRALKVELVKCRRRLACAEGDQQRLTAAEMRSTDDDGTRPQPVAADVAATATPSSASSTSRPCHKSYKTFLLHRPDRKRRREPDVRLVRK